MRSFLSLFAAIVLLVSCAAENSQFSGVSSVGQWSSVLSFTEGQDYRPTDVIILLDNSNSMRDNIEKVKSSMSDMIEAVSKDPNLDIRFYIASFTDQWIRYDRGIEKSVLYWLSSNQLTNFGTPSDMSSVLSYLENIKIYDYVTPYENGIGLAGLALEQIYGNEAEQREANVHVLVVSDEDNEALVFTNPADGKEVRIYEDRLMRSRPQYTYRFTYSEGQSNLSSQHKCVSKTTSSPLSPYSALRFYCKADSGEGMHVSYASSVSNRYLVSVPARHLCPVTTDGLTNMVEKSFGGAGCEPVEDSGKTNKILTSSDGVTFSGYPLVYEASPLTGCEEQFYYPSVTYVGDPLTEIKFGACRTGYELKITSGSRHLNSKVVAPGFSQDGIRVYAVGRYYNLITTEFLTEQEARQQFTELKPNAQNVQLTAPESAEAVLPPLSASPTGFKQLINEDLFKNREIYFNAIVAKSNAPCDGSTVANTSGKRYMELSEQTHGFVSDICGDSFQPIMRRLARNVLFSSIPSLDLPDDVNPEGYIIVRNLDTGEILTEEDYRIEGRRMTVFAKPGNYQVQQVDKHRLRPALKEQLGIE